MKTILLAILLIVFGALSVLAFQEAQMTEPVWWSLVLPTLIVVALWKYRVQRWIGRNWNPNISQDAFISSKPIAYWWLGMYFFLVCGFLVALGASQYYGFKVHSAAILGFFSFWWIKYELWGLLVCRNSESCGGGLES